MRCLFLISVCLLLLGIAKVAQADSAVTSDLSVTVRDHKGQPLAGVTVSFEPTGQDAVTDEKGAAKLAGLPYGTYPFHVSASHHRPLVISVTLAMPETRLDVTMEKRDAIAPNMRGHLEYLVTPPVPLGSGPAWRAAQEDILREAALRDLFASSPDLQHFPVVYLSVQGFPWEQEPQRDHDPSAAFLRRFRGSKPPVRAVSSLTAGRDHWQDHTRQRWIIFRVPPPRWISDTCVEVEANSQQAGCVSSDSLFLTCILRNGWWEITDFIELSG